MKENVDNISDKHVRTHMYLREMNAYERCFDRWTDIAKYAAISSTVFVAATVVLPRHPAVLCGFIVSTVTAALSMVASGLYLHKCDFIDRKYFGTDGDEDAEAGKTDEECCKEREVIVPSRTADGLEADSYKFLFWQFFLMAVGLVFLVVALIAKMHGMPVLKLCAKVPAVGFLFASLFYSTRRFIWSIRQRNLYGVEGFNDDNGELEVLPKVVGWCKWDGKYRDWFDVHHGDNGARLAVMNEIRRNRYRFGGTYHQQGQFGCPVMEDGTVYMVSMRSWGSIMADVWGGDYCEYAWSDVMGEVPRKSATPAEKTEEDIKAEQEAKKESEAEWRKSQEERERKLEEKNERNRKAMTTFVNSLSRKFAGHSSALVKYLRMELPGMLERSRDSTHGDDWKWVLSEKERARIEKENEKRRKEWLENFKKNGMDFLVDGSDVVEKKCEELPNGDC